MKFKVNFTKKYLRATNFLNEMNIKLGFFKNRKSEEFKKDLKELEELSLDLKAN